MEKQYGPRRRVLTLRIERDLYYRLSANASAANLSLVEYVSRFLPSLATAKPTPEEKEK